MTTYRNVEIEGFGNYQMSHESAATLSQVAAALSAQDGSVIPVKVFLTSIGDRLIAPIKEIRACTGYSLKNAKAVVDRIRAGGQRELLGIYPILQAEEIVSRFDEIGSTAEIQDPLSLLAEQI